MDLREQRFQHLLRPHRLLPARAETHGVASQGQATQDRRGPHLPPRSLRHDLQHRPPTVPCAARQSRQRNLPLQCHLAVERPRRRRRRHLRLHADDRGSDLVFLQGEGRLEAQLVLEIRGFDRQVDDHVFAPHRHGRQGCSEVAEPGQREREPDGVG